MNPNHMIKMIEPISTHTVTPIKMYFISKIKYYFKNRFKNLQIQTLLHV